MIEKLPPNEIVKIVQSAPEQTVFDWKQDFHAPRDDDAKGEIVKDLMAIANGTAFTHGTGYVFYGVHPGRPDPVVGASETWDDAKLQQIVASVLDPVPEFLLYDVDAGSGRTVVVLHVPMSKKPFHVMAKDLGRLREGQAVIRQGSSTRGITRADHMRLYLTVGGGYVEQVLQRYGQAAQIAHAENTRLQVLQQEQARLIRQMESMAGLPRGTIPT
jgi:hypothetical protein